MTIRTTLAAAAALALVAAPAWSDEDAMDEAVEATVVTLAHVHQRRRPRTPTATTRAS